MSPIKAIYSQHLEEIMSPMKFDYRSNSSPQLLEEMSQHIKDIFKVFPFTSQQDWVSTVLSRAGIKNVLSKMKDPGPGQLTSSEQIVKEILSYIDKSFTKDVYIMVWAGIKESSGRKLELEFIFNDNIDYSSTLSYLKNKYPYIDFRFSNFPEPYQPEKYDKEYKPLHLSTAKMLMADIMHELTVLTPELSEKFVVKIITNLSSLSFVGDTYASYLASSINKSFKQLTEEDLDKIYDSSILSKEDVSFEEIISALNIDKYCESLSAIQLSQLISVIDNSSRDFFSENSKEINKAFFLHEEKLFHEEIAKNKIPPKEKEQRLKAFEFGRSILDFSEEEIEDFLNFLKKENYQIDNFFSPLSFPTLENLIKLNNLTEKWLVEKNKIKVQPSEMDEVAIRVLSTQAMNILTNVLAQFGAGGLAESEPGKALLGSTLGHLLNKVHPAVGKELRVSSMHQVQELLINPITESLKNIKEEELIKLESKKAE